MTGPDAFGEVVEALEVIVAQCPPESDAARRAACYLACAVVRDRRRARDVAHDLISDDRGRVR